VRNGDTGIFKDITLFSATMVNALMKVAVITLAFTETAMTFAFYD